MASRTATRLTTPPTLADLLADRLPALAARLTSPVFDKELRVTARRKYTYWIRAAYALILAVLVLVVWLQMRLLSRAAPQSQKIVQAAEMARTLSLLLVWLQFIALHLVAVAAAGGGLSEEARRGTLAVLMTTPLRPLQIVVGKLTAGLAQPLVLLAIGVPALALLRVFGGVDWRTVWDGFWITVTAVIAVAAITLWFSLGTRHSHTAILRAMLAIGLLWVVLGGLPFWLGGGLGLRLLQLGLVSPAGALMLLTDRASYPGLVTGFSLPAHCLIMLGVGFVFAGLTAWRMRAAVWRHMGPTRERGGRLGAILLGESAHTRRRTKPLTAAPILWREWRLPGNRTTWLIAAIFVAVSLLLFITTGISSAGGWVYLHSMILTGFSLLICLRTLAMACTTMIAEKDGRTWPLLLTSPLDETRIIRHKALAVLARNAPLWLAILLGRVGNIVALSLTSTFAFLPGAGVPASLPVVVLLGNLISAVLSVVSLPVLLTGIGLYTGLRCKRRAAAIGLGIAVLFLVQIAVTILFGVLAMIPLAFFAGALGAFTSGTSALAMLPIVLSQLLSGVLTNAAYLSVGLLLIRRTRRRLRACVL